MTRDEAIRDFQENHGASWYLFVNSTLWRAARGIAMEFGPARKLPTFPPEEIVRNGVVFAANIAGWQDLLQTFENLLVPCGTTDDPTLNPSYLSEEPEPNVRPAPAPEAPRPKKPASKKK